MHKNKITNPIDMKNKIQIVNAYLKEYFNMFEKIKETQENVKYISDLLVELSVSKRLINELINRYNKI